jgi:hypothetical protein
MKGLIPSFYGRTPEPGAFLAAVRICFIDEKLPSLLIERRKIIF